MSTFKQIFVFFISSFDTFHFFFSFPFFFFFIFIFLFYFPSRRLFCSKFICFFFFFSLNRIRSLFMLVSNKLFFTFFASQFLLQKFIIFQSIYVDKVVIAFSDTPYFFHFLNLCIFTFFNL